MTEAEIVLWQRIKRKQINNLQFYHQKPLGKYVVDFYCPAAKLVIEIDGDNHLAELNIKNDFSRERYFIDNLKLKVLRFTNEVIMDDIEDVIEEITKETI